MPLLNILQQIKRKGVIQRPASPQVTQLALSQQRNAQSQNSHRLSTPGSANNKPVDPVVARLKAARKAEREKKEAEARARKGQAPKKELKPRSPAKPSVRSGAPNREKSKTPVGMPPVPIPPKEKKAKVSFSQLMKKASLIDQSKMSIQFKAKTKSPEPRQERRKPAKEAVARSSSDTQPRRKPLLANSAPQKAPAHDVPARPKIPIPARRPNPQLESKLRQKKTQDPGSGGRGEQDEYDEDSDMSSFIASDEEEEDMPRDYDREEIWAMFNKGRRRNFDYDDDSDDMEATGAEIFEEEARSKKRAMEEDRREMEEEQRRAELKRRRKAGIF